MRVHVNLHRGDFSVLSPRTGLLLASVDDISLTGVRFRVQPGCLERMLRVRQRAVCAYAVGHVQAVNTSPDVTGLRRVTFHPYRAATFTCEGRPVCAADRVTFRDRAGWV